MIVASRRWIGVGVATAAVVVGLVTACSSGSNSSGGGTTAAGGSSSPSMTMSTPMAASSGSQIEVKNFTFEPMMLSIAVGTTVTWKFDDSAQHTVSADDKSFVSPALSNGQTYTHTFTTAGTFQYICSIHQYMKGTIVVK